MAGLIHNNVCDWHVAQLDPISMSGIKKKQPKIPRLEFSLLFYYFETVIWFLV